MKKVATDIGEMPTLSISYDGQQDPTLHTRLEAFIYQARAYQQKNGHQPPWPSGPHAEAADRERGTDAPTDDPAEVR